MNSNNNPSIDPANNGSLAGSIRFAFGKMMQQVNGMLPAQVIKYDREANRVQVQLMISILTTGGQQIPRPQIASIPVLLIGGGGYMLNFPLKTGDFGWVIANDRDISLFLQTYSQGAPNTTRVKNFSDGLFIPDAMRNFTIDDEDEENAVLQSLDGTIKISLSETTITVKAPNIVLDGNVTVTGALNAQGGITSTGGAGPNQVQITGNVLVTGNIGATGTITPGV